MPVFANLAGDKVDQSTIRELTMTIDAQGNHHLVVHIKNRIPGKPGQPYTQFRELIQLYIPADATEVRGAGFLPRGSLYPGFSLGPLDRGSEFGWHGFGGLLVVEAGADGIVTLDYHRPPPGDDFNFSVVQQPGLTPWQLNLELNAPGLVPATPGSIDKGILRWQLKVSRDVALKAKRAGTAGEATP